MKEYRKKIRIGISVGDLNGIGMEVIIKTFLDNRMMDLCTPIIFGSSKSLSFHKKLLSIKKFNFHLITNLNDINDKQVNLINCWEESIKIHIGKSSKNIGNYALKSLSLACKALKKNHIDVLVTAPINKSSIQKNKKDFIGHTEYLSSQFGENPLMIMSSSNMKIACVTSHIAHSKVHKEITEDSIIQKIKIFNFSLRQDFGITKPKIGVVGLNPHAGENGMIGHEEKDIILPAIQKLKKIENILAFGPYSADSFFVEKNFKKFDGILCMYHDQGLIPFKTLSLAEGVNYTAGLSIVRTSPSHGTGYDIAGKNIANPQSFRESIYLSCDIIKKRRQFEKLHLNPL